MISWDFPELALHLQYLDGSFVSRLYEKNKGLVEVIETIVWNGNYIKLTILSTLLTINYK